MFCYKNEMWLKVLWIISLFYVIPTTSLKCPNAPESCANTTCEELLVCEFPKKRIDYCEPTQKPEDVGCCMRRVCTCAGTENGLSTSGTLAQVLHRAEWLYTNCTLVEGNVELVHIEKNVTFTKHIKEVTGYILISRFSGSLIDFSSLRLIRGGILYKDPPQPCKGTAEDAFRKATNRSSSNSNVTEYALYVSSNGPNGADNGLKELWMPNLTEITYGDVAIKDNHVLCYVDTVKFEDIFEYGHEQKAVIERNSEACSACSSSCYDDGGKRHCWGNEERNCQLLTKTGCNACELDNRRCVTKNGNQGCCNSNCAGGCFSASDHRACYACDTLNNDGVCTTHCPDGRTSDSSVITERKFEFAGYCVKECPDNVPRKDRFCVTYCPEGTFNFGGNVCESCEGRCGNICPALGVQNTIFEKESMINSINIMNFTKNCTVIEGSLHIKKFAFEGDRHCHVPPTDMSEFDRFENVREITGYLAIEEWPDFDLCVFKNLRRIHGKELLHGQYALSVYTDNSKNTKLRSLCLNSLEQIDRGVVQLYQQNLLCHTELIDWDQILLNNLSSSSEFDVKPQSNCGSILIMRNRYLCHQNSLNWTQFFADPKDQHHTIKGRKRKTCSMCNPQCDQDAGCWGQLATQCIKCKHFTDNTDANGQFVPDFVANAEGVIYPGNNMTTCVEKCVITKGVYASSGNYCLPCDPQCKKQCRGPGPSNCVECKNVYHNGTCMDECSEHEHYQVNTTCYTCNEGCIDGGCEGPAAKFDPLNGCVNCYTYYDTEERVTVYSGLRCSECSSSVIQMDCRLGCKKNGTLVTCIVDESLNLTAILVPIILFFVVLPIIIFTYCYRRHKSTIKKMRQTIGENMVGEHKLDDIESIPMTPSGATPNQAHLRIVKDTELNIGKMLGSGAFGEVHKAIWTPLNIQGEKIKIAVAVKTLKTPEDMSPCANNEIMDEAYVMASVDCEYLVRLLGIRMTENVSLITQLMPLGSLLEYVRDVKNHDNISSRQMLTWFVQIAKGMLYLQEKHLVHRDLAARNVLVRTPHHVKITDFGLAKMLDIREESYQAEGGKLPIKWLAIECITERLFSHLSDVWAYGITCWEILTYGSRPYDGVRAADVLILLERGDRLQQPPTATIEVYMLLIKCWMVDRISRPSFAELVAEFSRMAMDPKRYLVLQNDLGDCFSPNIVEENKFFQRLLEEEKVDDGIIAGEPDQYLLSRDLNNQSHYDYTPMSSFPTTLHFYWNRPVYANQEAVNITLGTHPTHAPDRLFSRSTPSAVLDQTAPSSTSTERARDSDLTRINSASDQDDVFSEAAQLSKHMAHGNLQGESRSNRKDSEERHRYTEDPTHKKTMLVNIDEKLPEDPGPSKYDEEQYLLPIENKAPVYLDPEGGSLVMPSSLMNDTYVDSPPLSGGGGPSQLPSPPATDYTMLTSCEGQSGVEYVNTKDKEGQNWFANEEYMATDSGIGEDTQSLLSRNATGKSSKRTDSPHSSGDENERLLHNSKVAFKPDRNHNGLSRPLNKPSSTSSETSSASCSSPTALNNPGYMFLNASTSNNSNKNLKKVKLDPVQDETSV